MSGYRSVRATTFLGVGTTHSVAKRATTIACLIGFAVLAVATPVTASTTRSGGEGQLARVSIRTDFLYSGNHAGFFVAKAKGWYRQAGLDVTINEGSGSTLTAQSVASGQDTFGYVAPSALINARAAGAPLVMVADLIQRDLASVLVLANSPIRNLRELEGKTCGITSFGYINKVIPAVFEKYGWNWDAVRKVTMTSAAIDTALATGQVDAQCEGLWNFIYLRNRGIQTRRFVVADYGINLMSHGIIANTNLVSSNPKLVNKFVKVTLKGYQWAVKNPGPAAAITGRLGNNNYTTVEDKQGQLDILKNYFHTTATKKKPVGWMARADWFNTVNLMVKYLGLRRSSVPGVNELFTNRFIPARDAIPIS